MVTGWLKVGFNTFFTVFLFDFLIDIEMVVDSPLEIETFGPAQVVPTPRTKTRDT